MGSQWMGFEFVFVSTVVVLPTGRFSQEIDWITAPYWQLVDEDQDVRIEDFL